VVRSPHWFYGNDDGNWELIGRPVLAFRRAGFDWEMAPAMSGDNQRRNFRVEGATESNKGFRAALAEIVERHPELLDWAIRFDGPWLSMHDVLAQPAFSWNDTFYHGTSEAALPFIRQHGICPRDVTGSRPAYGGEGKAGRPDTVYLTTQLGMARFAARDAGNVTRSPGVILAIDGVDPRKVVPDEDSGEATARASVDHMGSFGVRGCISPERVSIAQVWRDGAWQAVASAASLSAAVAVPYTIRRVPPLDGMYTIAAFIRRHRVGQLQWTQFGDVCPIGEIWVDPEYQRMGIGSALIAEAHRRCLRRYGLPLSSSGIVSPQLQRIFRKMEADGLAVWDGREWVIRA
jgi:GNAT superfamily N-acetyltransferase